MLSGSSGCAPEPLDLMGIQSAMLDHWARLTQIMSDSDSASNHRPFSVRRFHAFRCRAAELRHGLVSAHIWVGLWLYPEFRHGLALAQNLHDFLESNGSEMPKGR
ncbi:hypothetical protein TI39_contig698g00001 [Zymoseptoria brevis]|uniref:Uncharacterized protein n=1 Tax=Zymoseptoria brevis TaxID=1047168 RepID=A0A0F4GFJ7_9PEZI|nr:hypothetical protein TI39_contig698g00001 [Zymoseptoria brevis]